VKAVAVEQWLSTLPYAPSTKSKLHNQLSAMFNHAIRHELWEKANPIATVWQSAKRLATTDIPSLKEIRGILHNLERPMHRTAVLIAAVTGLRRFEIRGLK
jgi:integrase